MNSSGAAIRDSRAGYATVPDGEPYREIREKSSGSLGSYLRTIVPLQHPRWGDVSPYNSGCPAASSNAPNQVACVPSLHGRRDRRRRASRVTRITSGDASSALHSDYRSISRQRWTRRAIRVKRSVRGLDEHHRDSHHLDTRPMHRERRPILARRRDGPSHSTEAQ